MTCLVFLEVRAAESLRQAIASNWGRVRRGASARRVRRGASAGGRVTSPGGRQQLGARPPGRVRRGASARPRPPGRVRRGLPGALKILNEGGEKDPLLLMKAVRKTRCS